MDELMSMWRSKLQKIGSTIKPAGLFAVATVMDTVIRAFLLHQQRLPSFEESARNFPIYLVDEHGPMADLVLRQNNIYSWEDLQTALQIFIDTARGIGLEADQAILDLAGIHDDSGLISMVSDELSRRYTGCNPWTS